MCQINEIVLFIVHCSEAPPAYHEVCPQFAPQPILDVDTHNNVNVPEDNVHTAHTQPIILSPRAHDLTEVRC